MSVPRLDINHSAVLVVDMQEKLLPHMYNAQPLTAAAARLIDAANALQVPILVTEQYRKGLGPTVPPLAGRLATAVCNHEKLKFSACIEPIRSELSRLGRRSVVVCGIEAHVCVLQTCLDLIACGQITALACDATGSRREPDHRAAEQRMIQAGTIPTTVESAVLEWVHEAGSERFKSILPIIK